MFTCINEQASSQPKIKQAKSQRKTYGANNQICTAIQSKGRLAKATTQHDVPFCAHTYNACIVGKNRNSQINKQRAIFTHQQSALQHDNSERKKCSTSGKDRT